MSTRQILVAGVGNIFCNDDGFGPEAARVLAADLPRPGVRVVDYGIRGMHLAYDLLGGYERLILLDALPRGGEPGDVVVLEVGPADLAGPPGAAEIDAHGMAPAAMLSSLGQLGGVLPPTVVVGCEPADVDEGMGLSQPVAAAVEVAVDVVRRLLDSYLGTDPSLSPAHTPLRSSTSHQEVPS